jgi:hypothetical protein
MIGCDKSGLAARQARVGKVVWGLFLIGVGVLFTLDNLGIVEADGPSPFPMTQAVDGDPATRWSSAWRDPQWITVDLGTVTEIGKVRLSWELAYASDYEIAVSDDGQAWTTVTTVSGGDGGIDEHTVSARGRYVRMTGSKRAPIEGKKKRRYGYSLWELEVFGPEGELLSRGKPVRASSGEHGNRWTLYWPLFLVAPGLPLLLVPKDGGERVMGLLMSGAGVFLLARNFKLVDLGFWQAMPLLFILAGLILVLEAARPKNGDEPAEGVR